MQLRLLRVVLISAVATLLLVEFLVIGLIKSLHRTYLPETPPQIYLENNTSLTQEDSRKHATSPALTVLESLGNISMASSTVLKRCRRSGLIGALFTQFNFTSASNLDSGTRSRLKLGGGFRPLDCVPAASDRLAIIIPYRDRPGQLNALLTHLHPVLQRQQLDYRVFVVEQDGDESFNKGLLMNIGFAESSKDETAPFNCFIFHDVDLFVLDDRAIYECHDNPFHLSEFIDKFNYSPWRGADVLFGGVVAIRKRVFELVNGFTTVFFGWGAEDDEMKLRLKHYNIPIKTPSPAFYRYRMVKHQQDKLNPWNENGIILLGQTNARMHFDGLNSMRYDVVRRDLLQTYTHLLVRFKRYEIYETVYGRITEDLNKYARTTRHV